MLKKLLSLVIAFMLIISMAIPCFAYELTNYKWKSNTIYYYYDNWIGSRAISYLSLGATAWKNATTQATISYKAGSGVYCQVRQNEELDWDGLTSTTYVSGYVTSQTLTLNQGATATWNNDGALKSVVVHEMGHVFGLYENGDTQTVMNENTWGANSRYATFKITAPCSDDINGVNAIY